MNRHVEFFGNATHVVSRIDHYAIDCKATRCVKILQFSMAGVAESKEMAHLRDRVWPV